MEILYYVGLGVLSVLGIAIIATVLWFVFALAVCFWKIHFKKKPEKKCNHHNTRYTENHPEKMWTCCDCGENVY